MILRLLGTAVLTLTVQIAIESAAERPLIAISRNGCSWPRVCGNSLRHLLSDSAEFVAGADDELIH